MPDSRARLRSNGLPRSVRLHSSADRCDCRAGRPACRRQARPHAFCQGRSQRLDAVNLYRRIVEKWWKRPMALEPPRYRQRANREPAFGSLHLRFGFLADHALEIAHHGGGRMRPRRGADAIEVFSTLVTQSRKASFIASFRSWRQTPLARPWHRAASCERRWALAVRHRQTPCRRCTRVQIWRKRWLSRRHADRRPFQR